MGTEQEAKQEQAAHAKPEEKVAVAVAEENKEEKAAAAEDNKKEDDQEKKKVEEEEEPPSPCILHVDLHCVGCAKKIEKCILKIKGVEGVVMDMAKNQVTLKGIVDPQAVCNIISNKTKRKPQILSPLLPPAAADQGQQLIVSSQVSVATTVELNVNMHCEACAEQLKRKILKMRGVQSVSTELATEKVIVTGTMDPDKLVEYVYRRTKKQARIVPQPEPEPDNQKQEEKEKEEEKPTDPPAGEEKKDEELEEKKKDEDIEKMEKGDDDDDEMMILRSDEDQEEEEAENNMKRMMYYYNYQPLYVINDKMPPAPQLFSDENPNACCIT